MARIVGPDHVNWKKKGGGASKFPSEWFNGQVWELTIRDFPDSASLINARIALRTRTRRMGLVSRASIQNEKLYFEVLGKIEDEFKHD